MRVITQDNQWGSLKNGKFKRETNFVLSLEVLCESTDAAELRVPCRIDKTPWWEEGSVKHFKRNS